MGTTYRQIVERCLSDLPRKYRSGRQHQARPHLDAECRLIVELGQESALIHATEFSADLTRKGIHCHLIGSGCSSLVTYLLGLSEVDPILYGTSFNRFWLTSDGTAPAFQFVTYPAVETALPNGITAHPMTPLERIPAVMEESLPPVDLTRADPATFNAINTGDMDSVFQLGTQPVRDLIARLCPKRIKDLTVITALNLIDGHHPDVVETCLNQTEKSNRARRPIIFQETILRLLRNRAGLTWEEECQFLRTAAKGRMNEGHPLWSKAVEGTHLQTPGDKEDIPAILPTLTTAAEWAVCQAHHAANAITSYKAAFYRTHHRADFEAAVKQVAALS